MKSTPLVILQGKTFTRILRLASLPYVYKPITAITKAAPAVITCPTHGVLDGMQIAIVSVQGMTQINALKSPPDLTTDYHKATVVDVNTISLNDVNSTGFGTYTSGGYVQYLTPVDMTSAIARMSIKSSVSSTTSLLDLTTTNGGIIINNTTKTMTLLIPAATTALMTWKTGVYDLEMQDANGIISLILSGSISVTPEVTTIET